MPTRQSSKISEQSEQAEAQQSSIPPSPSISNSSHTNMHNQAFILYSDDQIMSNSLESSHALSQKSSNLSHSSIYSSIDNLNRKKGERSQILDCLSPSHQESSIADLHLSECSDSGLSLIKGLGPLFDSKTFLRRSPRFAIHEAQNSNQEKQPLLTTINNFSLKQLKPEMIQDEKPVNSPALQRQQNSSKIIEENSEQHLSLFRTSFFQSPQLQNSQINKLYESNQFTRLTRSSKKLNQQETQSLTVNNRIDASNQSKLSHSEHLAKITKEYILRNRKEKKIKKVQQKMFSYGLRGYINDSKSFRRS